LSVVEMRSGRLVAVKGGHCPMACAKSGSLCESHAARARRCARSSRTSTRVPVSHERRHSSSLWWRVACQAGRRGRGGSLHRVGETFLGPVCMLGTGALGWRGHPRPRPP
jgi:hypothetical protein